MRVTIYTQYIETELEIKAFEAVIKGLKKELAIMLNKCAPRNVVGIAYDRPAIQSVSYHSDLDDLLKIDELQGRITIKEMLLNEARETFNDLTSVLYEASKRLRNDREIEVFRLSRANYDNQSIADKLQCELHTVENTRWAINKYIQEVTENIN